MKTIGNVIKIMDGFGVKLSIDNVRKLEIKGIVMTTRNAKNRYREFTDEQFKQTIRNLLLYYFNTPVDVIKKNDSVEMASRISKIRKAVKDIVQK